MSKTKQKQPEIREISPVDACTLLHSEHSLPLRGLPVTACIHTEQDEDERSTLEGCLSAATVNNHCNAIETKMAESQPPSI